jgi:hypothetical protein
MNLSNRAKMQAVASSLVLVVWFGLLLPGFTGCASAPHPLAPGVAGAQRVQEVLGRWNEAQGGQRRLAAIQNVQCLVRVEEGLGHNFVRSVEMADGRYRYDLMIGAEGSIGGGYDGLRGWQDSGAWGSGVYPGQRGDPFWSVWCLRALQMENVFLNRRLLPDENIDGHACAVLGLTPEGKPEERWYFDRQSGQLLRVIKSGGGEESVLTYSDYRTVSRIKIPFVVKVSSRGKTLVVYQRLSVKTNVAVKPVDFFPTESMLRQAEEMDNLLKRSVDGGALAGAESKSSLVHATISSATSGIKTELTVHRRKPGLVLVEKEGAGLGRTLSGYDGNTGWENSEILGFHLLKEGELNDLMSLSWLGADPYLRERFPLRSKMGETTLAGRKAIKLRMRTFSGLSGRFYFDKENARLLRVEMEENLSTGVRAMSVEYSDHRAVGAGNMPFCVRYESGGSETVITCNSVELDVEMPDSLFRPRTETD